MTVEAFMAQADADRQQREQAREDFVKWARERYSCDWRHLCGCVLNLAMDDVTDCTDNVDRVRDFAAAHGWPDTLRAIAQAMDADERERRELVDRR